MKKLLQELTEIPAPSGAEEAIRTYLRTTLEPLVDEIRVDALGNLITRKGQAGKGGKRILLAAHMDEIGVIVSHVDENGFVRFSPLGGVFGRYLPGGRVRFVNGVSGVIGLEPQDKPTEIPPLEKMFIDVGATRRQDCPLTIGDVAVFDRPFLDLGDRLVSKAMDDRAGVAVLIETLRLLQNSPHELYFVFTTQEEVGVRGAVTAAFGVDPEIGLAVDVTPAADTPAPRPGEIALGKGPAIKIKDAGMLSDPRLVQWMTRIAEKKRIPYQREILLGGSTDARAIQINRSGVISGALSLPVRYVHSPSEMVDHTDLQNAVQLLLALLSAPIPLE